MKQWKRLVSLWLVLSIIFPTNLLMFVAQAVEETNEKVSNLHVIWNGEIGTEFHSGEGTKTNPYVISNGQELAYLSFDISQGNGLKYSGKYFIMDSDIYLNDTSYSEWYKSDSCQQGFPIGSFKNWGSMLFGYSSDQQYEFFG